MFIQKPLKPISGRDGLVASCGSAVAEKPSWAEVAAEVVVVVVVELETKPIVGGRLCCEEVMTVASEEGWAATAVTAAAAAVGVADRLQRYGQSAGGNMNAAVAAIGEGVNGGGTTRFRTVWGER